MSHHRSRGALLFSFATALLLALIAVSCASGTTERSTGTAVPAPASAGEKLAGPPEFGGSLVVGLPSETDSFSPYSGQWSASSYSVGNAIFDPLVASDELGIPHQYLAKSIAPTGDFLEWTIGLRENIKFHNGEVLDAAAVKKNLDIGRSSGLTSQAFAVVKSIDVVDPLTVSVKMTQPWATFPASLSGQGGYMAAPAMLDDPAGKNANPVGTGPFKFVDRQRDSYVKLTRNPDYWQKDANGKSLPYLDSVRFNVITDNGSRTSAMTAGDIDANLIVTPNEFVTAKESARTGELQIVTDEGQETDELILALNASKPPFNDINARKALAVGINQEALSKAAFQGAFPGAWGMFEEGSPHYVSRQDAGYPDYDANKAREMVKQYEKDHGQPLQFQLLVPPDAQYLAIAQTFQSQAKDLGIQVELQAIEQTQMITKVVVQGDYQASGFVLWSSPTPDRAYVFLATKANPTGLSLNFPRFDDPELVKAFDQFRGTGKAEGNLKVVQQELAKNIPVLFLVHQHSAYIYKNNTHGVQSTNFPGTDRKAYTPYLTTPFLVNVWRTGAGS